MSFALSAASILADIAPFALLAGAINVVIPYALAALGGLASERGGVVNIALEGIMLVGAFGYVLGAHLGGGGAAVQAVLAGVALGVVGGLLISSLLAYVTITLRGDQIVAGLAINLLAIGATRWMLEAVFDSASNSSTVTTMGPIVTLDTNNALAPLMVLTHPLFLGLIFAVLGLSWALRRTVWGLRLRAVGEYPLAARSLGVSVPTIRWSGVLLGGILAAAAGIWLASDQGRFTQRMTSGRGYIALSILIVGRWNPMGVLAGASVLGLAEACTNRLQTLPATEGSFLFTLQRHREWILAMPYFMTLFVLAGIAGGSRAPAALGRPYDPNGTDR